MGNDWQPLQPIGAEATGKVISVHFHVPVGPLAWDEGIVAPQGVAPAWVNGRGFEVTLASAPEQIQSVAITGSNMDTVQITCADTVEGQYVNVAYAYSAGSALTMTPDANGLSFSNRTLRWGQLRDSDPFLGSTTGVAQPNYAVSFSIACRIPSSLRPGDRLASAQAEERQHDLQQDQHHHRLLQQNQAPIARHVQHQLQRLLDAAQLQLQRLVRSTRSNSARSSS